MPTLYVATTGGHLKELVEIADRLPPDVDDIELWASEENAHSRSLLEGKNHIFVREVTTKDVVNVIRSLPVAHRLQQKWKFTRVISTGSGLALAYLPYLSLRGVRAHYIESATRLTAPSLSGRLLQAVPGIRLYTQYPQLADKRWNYGGWLYDGFVATKRTEHAAIRRAVVTLGTAQDFPARRILEAIARILKPGGILEVMQESPVEVLWQTGGTPTGGLGIEATPFVPSAELDAALARADVVIGHAGAGTAHSALTAGLKPVLVPRDPTRGELADTHQTLFAHLLDERGLAIHREADALTVDDLLEAANYRVAPTAEPPTFRLLP